MEVAYIETIKGLVKAGLGNIHIAWQGSWAGTLRRHPDQGKNTGCWLLKKSRCRLSQDKFLSRLLLNFWGFWRRDKRQPPNLFYKYMILTAIIFLLFKCSPSFSFLPWNLQPVVTFHARREWSIKQRHITVSVITYRNQNECQSRTRLYISLHDSDGSIVFCNSNWKDGTCRMDLFEVQTGMIRVCLKLAIKPLRLLSDWFRQRSIALPIRLCCFWDHRLSTCNGLVLPLLCSAKASSASL